MKNTDNQTDDTTDKLKEELLKFADEFELSAADNLAMAEELAQQRELERNYRNSKLLNYILFAVIVVFFLVANN